MKKNKIKFDYIVYLVFALVFLFDYILNIERIHFFVNFTFLINGIISYIGFIRDRRFLSINKLISIFLFLFCYLAPFHQYQQNHVFWGVSPFSDLEYINGNIIVFIFELIWYGLPILIKSKSFKRKKRLFNFDLGINLNNLILTIFIFISCGCLLYLLFTGNLIKDDSSSSTTDSFFIFFIKIIRFFPVGSLLLYVFSRKKNLIIATNIVRKIFCIITITITLVIFFPLNASISRYLLFGVYIIILSALIPQYKHNSIVLIACAIGFYVIFPSMNFFKYNSILDLTNFEFSTMDYTSNDYDAYQMLLSSVRYVSTNGFMFGRNILTALLCFLPRSIWSGKLLPSGQIINESINISFTNVSCPLFAEFYLSFGFLGVILLTILFVLIIKWIENNASNSIFIRSFECIIIGMAMMIMRGSLLPISTFVVSLLVSFMIAYIITLLLSKKNT